LPIRFFDEQYFKKVYPHRLSYPKMIQQMFKLHVFDLPWLLPNVAIVDSDTVWSRDHTFVYANGSAVYFNDLYHPRGQQTPSTECTGMNPTAYVDHLLRGSGCNFSKWCGSPWATGVFHIAHHMLFQRDVMQGLHSAAIAAHGGGSLWEATERCAHNTPNRSCLGRFAEYELYYTYAECKHKSRVIDAALPFIGSGGNCSRAEMEICRQKGALLKMCNDGGGGRRGMCENLNTVDKREQWTRVWRK
jgi:hypothetical protein